MGEFRSAFTSGHCTLTSVADTLSAATPTGAEGTVECVCVCERGRERGRQGEREDESVSERG